MTLTLWTSDALFASASSARDSNSWPPRSLPGVQTWWRKYWSPYRWNISFAASVIVSGGTGMVRIVVYSRRPPAFRINVNRVERARLTVYSPAGSVFFPTKKLNGTFITILSADCAYAGAAAGMVKRLNNVIALKAWFFIWPPSVFFKAAVEAGRPQWAVGMILLAGRSNQLDLRFTY